MSRKKSSSPKGTAPSSLTPGRFDEAPTHSLADTVQANILAALQGMQELATRHPEEERPAWNKHLREFQAALRFVHKQHPGEVQPTDAILDREQLGAFAAKVQQAREALGWNQTDLANKAGLSISTIKHIEKARHMPYKTTLLQLLAVKELGLDSRAVPWPAVTTSDFGTAPNCWIAPGYDSIKMFADLLGLVNGRGGTIEQTYAYLDHKSAYNYFDLTNQASYVTDSRASSPVNAMAQQILESTGRAGLDLIALGAGDGKTEVHLAQHLIDRVQKKHPGHVDLRLYLLDISQPLLSEAYRHAASTIGQNQGVMLCAVQGDFYHLPRYSQLHHTPERSHRRRILVMFGGTVGNLVDEQRFFRHSLVGFAPGDMLLVQLQPGHASPDNPAEIRRKDPGLQGGLPAEYAEFLAGPLWRYCKDVTDVSFDLVLDTHCSVPGSYSLDAVAKVKLRDLREKRYQVFRFKRYDTKRFAVWLRSFGWELVKEIPFGADPSAPKHALLLFRLVPGDF